MKQIMLACTGLILTSQAMAQSNVTVYGLLDEALMYTSHAATTGGVVQLKSGALNTSRFGFRGSEQLGGGARAVFQLESGTRLDTGTQDDASSLFNRQATVGVEGSFGRVVAGRSFSTTYDFMVPFDPMGFAPVYSWAVSSTATPLKGSTVVRKDGLLGGVSNLVKYQGAVGAVKLGASYGVGEEPGSTLGSAKYGLAVSSSVGQVNFVATADRQYGATLASGVRDKTDTYHLGLSEQAGAATFYAAVRDFRKTLAVGGAVQHSQTSWVGVAYNASSNLALTAALYHQDFRHMDKAGDPTMLVFRVRYALSPTMDIYTVLAHARARNGQAVSLSRDDSGFADQQQGIAVGTQLRF